MHVNQYLTRIKKILTILHQMTKKQNKMKIKRTFSLQRQTLDLNYKILHIHFRYNTNFFFPNNNWSIFLTNWFRLFLTSINYICKNVRFPPFFFQFIKNTKP